MQLLIDGMFFIQNHLKPLASIARIRHFSAGNGYREVEISDYDWNTSPREQFRLWCLFANMQTFLYK